MLPLHFEKRDFSEKLISFLKYSLEREFASIGQGMGFIPTFSAYEETKGTYLEAVEEFWLDPGVRAELDETLRMIDQHSPQTIAATA